MVSEQSTGEQLIPISHEFDGSSILTSSYTSHNLFLHTNRMKITRDDPEKNISIPFSHVFGSSYITYILPLDPVFEDEEEVFRYRIGEEKYQSTL